MKNLTLIAGLALAFGLTLQAGAPTTDYSGNWTCMHGRQKIPGGLTQRGNNLDGYCIYPDGKRATFTGKINGNKFTGTLQVDKNTQRAITGTISGNSMEGTWKAKGNAGGGPWKATRDK